MFATSIISAALLFVSAVNAVEINYGANNRTVKYYHLGADPVQKCGAPYAVKKEIIFDETCGVDLSVKISGSNNPAVNFYNIQDNGSYFVKNIYTDSNCSGSAISTTYTKSCVGYTTGTATLSLATPTLVADGEKESVNLVSSNWQEPFLEELFKQYGSVVRFRDTEVNGYYIGSYGNLRRFVEDNIDTAFDITLSNITGYLALSSGSCRNLLPTGNNDTFFSIKTINTFTLDYVLHTDSNCNDAGSTIGQVLTGSGQARNFIIDVTGTSVVSTTSSGTSTLEFTVNNSAYTFSTYAYASYTVGGSLATTVPGSDITAPPSTSSPTSTTSTTSRATGSSIVQESSNAAVPTGVNAYVPILAGIAAAGGALLI